MIRSTRRTAEHRPATRRRRFAHDDLVAVDLFSGFGGLTRGIEQAGFTTIMAANHNTYKVKVHEANHPAAEHWIADLVNSESSDYHSARDLPAADILVAGVSCTNHSIANTQRAYEQRMSLFDLDDPDFDARVTRSERDRATANCVLHYAAQHHPRMILVECTTELTSWGPAIPGRPKIGDGTTYRWWLKQFDNLGYQHRVLYLNSMFFGVPQSRDRYYCVFWDKGMHSPDLEHRPTSWCGRCSELVPAVWSWKTGVPPTGAVRYGKQYNYRCPRCRTEIIPPMTPSINALDLSDLGPRIGDRTTPLAPATMARAERCRQRFAEFPAVLKRVEAAPGQETTLLTTSEIGQCAALTGQVFAAHRHNGDGQNISRPMDTVTSTHEKAVLLAAVNNYQGGPRGIGEPLPTQGGSETMGLLTASGGVGLPSPSVAPLRRNTVPTLRAELASAVTSDQTPGMLTAAGFIKNNGTIGESKYRAHPVSHPLGAVVASSANQGLLFSGWHAPTDTEPAPEWWIEALAGLTLENCHFRMLGKHEVGRGCGFDVDFADHQGSFVVWGSARDQVDGFGNAVSPQVGEWIGSRLRAALHGQGPQL